MMKGLKELLYEETLQHLVLLNVHLYLKQTEVQSHWTCWWPLALNEIRHN